MRSRDRPYEDESYDDASDDPYESEKYDDSSLLPFGPRTAWGWVPVGSSRTGDEETHPEETYSDEGVYSGEGTHPEGRERGSRDEEGLWDEALISLLLIVGVALFLFPEPATSGLGIVLITLGLLGVVVDVVVRSNE